MLDDIEKFVLAGDWHGSYGQAERVIQYAKRHAIPAIVQVGDFGIWNNDQKFLNKLQYDMEKYGKVLYFIDGNHENFPRLYEYPIVEDGTRQVRDNIFHLPRGFRWEWSGMSFLALGGAASIDKHFRVEGKSWWAEEAITEEDIAKAQEGGKVDVMITHDSPTGAPNAITDDPYGQAMARKNFGGDVLDYCYEQRQLLKQVTDVVTPRFLFHGHYHMWMEGIYTHDDEDQTIGYVQGLHQGNGPFMQHIFVFDIENHRTEQLEALNSYTKE